MRIVHRLLLRLLLLLPLAVVPAAAQLRGPVPAYDLEACLQMALRKNPDIRLADANTQAAAANLTAAFGAYLPGASVQANYNRQLTNLQPQLSFVSGIPLLGEPLPNNYSMSAGASWTIFNGFLRESRYDQARLSVDAADLGGRAQRWQIELDVRRQYVAVLRALQIVKTRRENIELGNATLTRIKAQYESGRGAVTAVYSQEADLANQEFELVRADNDLALAKAQLLTTMGLEPDSPADFLESSLPTEASADDVRRFRADLGGEDACVARAMTRRPDVLASDVRIETARAGITSAESGYYPTITATGGYAWRNTEIAAFDRQGQMSVGLDVRIPIFDRFVTNNEIEQATLTLRQREVDRMKLEQSVRQSVQSAFLALASAEKQLEISDRAIRAADLNFRAAQERFNVGAANQLDVQQANNQLILARINRITAVYAYIDARFQADFASGRINP